MSEKPLRVSVIKISNILGIHEAEIRPGKVTLISGANGTGKTSTLEAIRAVISGGHDATLLKRGEEVGSVVLVLDDGTEIRKEITADKTNVTVSHPEHGKVSKPRSLIERLVDSFSLNPVDFLTADRKARLQLFLGAIPLKVSKADLGEILPLCTSTPDLNAHALPVLALLQKDLYDQRTGVNRVVKEKRASAEEMKKALPSESQESSAEALKEARSAYATFTAKKSDALKAITAEAEQLKQTEDREYQKELASLTARHVRALEEIRQNQNAQRDELDATWREKEQELDRAVATAQAAEETYGKSEDARAHIQKLLLSAKEFDSKAEALSAGLRELDEIRSSLLDQLPIKGVTVEDGEILVDGIAFDRVNESRKVRLAIDIAMLRAGRLRFLPVDGIEKLDQKSLAALCSVAQEENIQLVLAQVSEGPLTVRNLA